MMTSTDLFETPHRERYFEDYVEGLVLNFGSVTVDEQEVIDFAKRYDPQFFHTDPVKAKESPFGGLIASGWHTGSMMMNLLTQYYFSDASSLGSPGLENLRWKAPVRPGDVLRVRVTILEARKSASKPDRGIVKHRIEVLNQTDDVVMDLVASNFVSCRKTA